MNINKIEMTGYTLYHIKSDKFKTFAIGACLIDKFDSKQMAEGVLLSNYLGSVNNNFQTKKELSTHLTNLYGMSVGLTYGTVGFTSWMQCTVKSINNKYLKDSDINLFHEATKVLYDTLFNPFFNKKTFNQEKMLLLEDIENSLDNKTVYASLRFTSEMYKGEKFSIPSYGSVEQVKAMTFTSVKEKYEKILSSKKFFFVYGDIELEQIKKEFAIFQFEKTCNEVFNFIDNEEKQIEKINEIIEEQEYNQTLIYMGYRTNIRYFDKLELGMVLFSAMMGGFFHSTLFQEIREKRSLSYNVGCDNFPRKGSFIIYAGISADKIDEFKEVVGKIIKDYQEGLIDDENFELSKKALISAQYKAADRFNYGTSLIIDDITGIPNSSIEEKIASIKSITKEDVINAAKKLELDTIYILKGNL